MSTKPIARSGVLPLFRVVIVTAPAVPGCRKWDQVLFRPAALRGSGVLVLLGPEPISRGPLVSAKIALGYDDDGLLYCLDAFGLGLLPGVLAIKRCRHQGSRGLCQFPGLDSCLGSVPLGFFYKRTFPRFIRRMNKGFT